MFGMMEALLSFLRRQIGLRDDAASATGSLHAKVATILAKNVVVNDSVIKSIQRGVMSTESTGYNFTTTISSVNTAKTKLNFLGGTNCNYITLTNATTITARKPGSGVNDSANASYEVIEYY